MIWLKVFLLLWCLGVMAFLGWAWYDHYTFWKKMGYYK